MKLNNVFFPILVLVWLGCKAPLVPSSHTQSLYSIQDTLQSDSASAISIYLKPYRDSLSGIMNEVIGQANGDFRKDNGSLGNFVADAVYHKAKLLDPNCIGAIYNPGGIRIPEIKKGSITRGKMFELLPFENELVILSIQGSILEKWMNLIGENGSWPLSETFSASYSTTKKIQSIGEDSSMIKKQDGSTQWMVITRMIQPETIYHIATNDYIANGGDNCDFLKDQERTKTGILIRDILIDELKLSKQVSPDNSSRIHFEHN